VKLSKIKDNIKTWGNKIDTRTLIYKESIIERHEGNDCGNKEETSKVDLV
jgi:hypothetical protein